MKQEGDSMFSWLIALALGGLLFWMWLRQDQERMRNAREQAEDALRRAERAAKDTGDRLKSTLDEGRERAEDLVEAGRARATELKSQVDEARADVQRRAAEFRQDVEEQAGRVVDQAQDRLGDLREAVEERVDQAQDRIGDLRETVEERVDKAEDKAEDVVETAVAKADERAEDLREKLEDALRETRLGTTETSAVVPDEIPVAVDPDVVSKAHSLADQLREAHAAEVRDDLVRIEGIGERTAQALYKGGVNTFAQLAALTDVRIRELLEAEGVRVHSSLPSWREQATRFDDEKNKS